MSLQSLKNLVSRAMPILDKNLHAAHSEWMSGEIARGAYEYCLSRHTTAIELLSLDDIDPERAFRACAPITIDLRTGLKDMQDKTQSEGLMEAWLDCFRSAGFSEMHPLFDIPYKPNSDPETKHVA